MKRMLVCALVLCFMLIIVPLIAVGGFPEWSEALSGEITYESFPADEPEQTVTDTDGLLLEHVKKPEDFVLYDEASKGLITVSAAEFLYGAVVCEMPLSFDDEALKAQAVACHSYYAQKRSAARAAPKEELMGGDFAVNTEEWSIYTTKAQMQKKWGGSFEKHYSRLTGLINEVSDVIMVYDGSPIVAAFHSLSGGMTEDAFNVWGAKYPYLTAVESPGDALAPSYQTETVFSADSFKEILEKNIKGIRLGEDPKAWVGELSRTPSDTVIMCALGDRKASGREMREFFSLRSAVFELEYKEGSFIFTVRGHGHGVGMSQYGAQEMARQGAGYAEILRWYYRVETQEDPGV